MTALTPAAADNDDHLPGPLAVGDVVSFYGATSVCESTGFWAAGRPMKYGDEYAITEAFLEANPPEQKGSLWSIIDDESEQIRRYGTVLARRGPWPGGMVRTEPGTPEHDLARKDAERRAWQQNGHPADALAQIEVVHAVYGRPPQTNRSTPTVSIR